MQDTSSLSVKAKFNFGAAAAGQERGLQRLKSTAAADMKSAEEAVTRVNPENPSFNIRPRSQVRLQHSAQIKHTFRGVAEKNNQLQLKLKAVRPDSRRSIATGGAGGRSSSVQTRKERERHQRGLSWVTPASILKEWIMTEAEMSSQQEEQEFDFSYLFEGCQAAQNESDRDAYNYTPNVSLPIGMGNPCLSTQYHTLQSSPVIPVSSCHQTGYSVQNDNHAASSYYLPQALRPNGAPALESPRIEITAYSQYPEDEVEASGREDHIIKRGVNSIVTLTLPNVDGYRDPSCLSPASSISSRSCNSETSSYESGFYNYDNSPQNSPWQSPSVSPRRSSSLLSCPHAIGPAASPHHSPSNSPQIGAMAEEGWPAQPRGSRPNSPSCSGVGGGNSGGIGKRKYSFSGSSYQQTSCSPNQSPTPSSHGSPRVSVTDENWLTNTNQYTNLAIVAAINALTTDGMADMGEGIPIKTRKTMLDLSPSMSLKVEPGGEDLGPEGELRHDEYSSRLSLKKENYCGGFLDVPQHPYSWSKPKPYLSHSLPALDWQLPSCSGPYNLQIEVQPKSHHRAHYETEGSRGAVKALSGGHPVVQSKIENLS
ncbi:hypothetical protein CCH79_00012053 [Gambusia affinis]|uniref:RHD domain-containing protein n=1 Tax=Gambusia affinis TaxID=33528 RepID=A0A315W9C5_GAMAF|nr:hypothetical protein CCH79_00012053 [Gambusia affinis]